MDYTRYTAQDFVLDEYFQAWVFSPNQQNRIFWQQWLREHPHQQKEVAAAKEILLSLSFQEPEVSPQEIAHLKVRVMRNTSASKLTKIIGQPKKVSLSTKPAYLKWAASITVLLTITGLLYFFLLHSGSMVEYQTGYGEIQEITLPDGSQVTLNANSTLQYATDWEKQEHRLIQLEGEAFFNVVKDSISQRNKAELSPTSTSLMPRKFVVQTHELSLEVLGTQFNVRARHLETEVVLQEGRIQLTVAGDDRQKAIAMEPGERIVVANKTLEQQVVEPEKYLSWRENQLVFDDVPLSKVAQTLEDTYGVQVVFANEQLRNLMFNGAVPSGNIEILLDALSGIYHLQISRKENVIIFHKRK